jgi:pimeloyl-ACP methyl ester carboxylesterase
VSRGVTVFLAVLCAIASVAVVSVAGSSAPADAAATPRDTGAVRWRECGHGVECGRVSAPVDYAHPEAGAVAIAVARVPATDREHRRGSLFVNFGGPGDPGTASLRDFALTVPREVRRRYDLVSFDPRGTGRSRPIDCLSDRQADRLFAIDPTPDTTAALRASYAGRYGSIDYVQACIDRYGTWLARVGSRNVARDLDRLRAAVGDDRLEYLGFSYGSVIGSVYAQQFPNRVGRMVLDSPVDMSDQSEQDIDESTASFEHALDAFLAQCARDHECAFHSGGHPRAALRVLQQRFERGLELRVTGEGADGDGHGRARTAGVAAFYTGVLSALYDRQYGWPELAGALDDARNGDGTALLALADLYNGRAPDGSYDNIGESGPVISCADWPDPRERYDDFVAEYRRARSEYPFLGAFVNDLPAGCDPRLPAPTEAEVVGDVEARGIPPVLVVGTTGDPATPYAGAVDLRARLQGSTLLTFEGTQHTAYGTSDCVDFYVDRYLLRGTLPPAGKRCRR